MPFLFFLPLCNHGRSKPPPYKNFVTDEMYFLVGPDAHIGPQNTGRLMPTGTH